MILGWHRECKGLIFKAFLISQKIFKIEARIGYRILGWCGLEEMLNNLVHSRNIFHQPRVSFVIGLKVIFRVTK